MTIIVSAQPLFEDGTVGGWQDEVVTDNSAVAGEFLFKLAERIGEVSADQFGNEVRCDAIDVTVTVRA